MCRAWNVFFRKTSDTEGSAASRGLLDCFIELLGASGDAHAAPAAPY